MLKSSKTQFENQVSSLSKQKLILGSQQSLREPGDESTPGVRVESEKSDGERSRRRTRSSLETIFPYYFNQVSALSLQGNLSFSRRIPVGLITKSFALSSQPDGRRCQSGGEKIERASYAKLREFQQTFNWLQVLPKKVLPCKSAKTATSTILKTVR